MAEITIISDLKQRHLEAWEAAYFELITHDGKTKPGKNTDNGAVIRAAAKAGMLTGDVGDVGDMTPKAAAKLAGAINAAYLEAVTIDPNS